MDLSIVWQFPKVLLGFPGDSVVKNPPIKIEMGKELRVWFLDGEGHLEEDRATNSSTVAWERTEEPWGLQFTDRKELDTTYPWALSPSENFWLPGNLKVFQRTPESSQREIFN